MKLTAVIMAAGQGTRMRSALPKVLHPLGGRPMIDYSLRLARALGDDRPVVVIGHGAELVRQTVGDAARFVVQQPQLGTAHAVMQAAPLLDAGGLVLVTSADMPLLTLETLTAMVETQRQNPGPMTMLTMIEPDPRGFGRIIRASDGSVRAIVEEAQATPEQLAIRELNVGAYCFSAEWLLQALPRVPLSRKGEYYVTDTVELASNDGLRVEALVVNDTSEAIGINTRAHLAEAETILRRRTNRAWMESGVTLIDPQTTYIDPGVRIGRDTIIYPNTSLRGSAQVGEDCRIGPNTIITDSQVGAGSTVLASVVERFILRDGSRVGPFEHLCKDEVKTSQTL